MEETKILGILDMLSSRAKEFIQVKEEFLEGEGSLQAKDDVDPTDWQAACLLSAFINYIGEHERCRYGHYAYDLSPKNNEHKRSDATSVIDRMKVLWNRFGIGLSEEQEEARQAKYRKFLENDKRIREHLKKKPDLYGEDTDPMDHRDWMIRLRVLSDNEQKILTEWWELLHEQSTADDDAPVEDCEPPTCDDV